MASKSYIKTVVTVGLKLLLICAVIAGVVSFVYTATYDAYQQNLDREIRQSMAVIFEAEENDVIDLTVYDGTLESDITAVYTVRKNGELVGYCINLSGKGFGGDMNLMVGYHVDKSIRGISVVSHAETPGVGTKAMTKAHLGQYEGLSGSISLSKNGEADVTAVSGATISSKAIHAAIERASELVALLPLA